MRTYQVATIMSLAVRSFAWPQSARDQLADLAAEFDPALASVADILRVRRAAIPDQASIYWSFSSSDRAVQA